MSKAVLISINPKWCELIASGKKTIEIRKTKPKLETSFKCYIYQTNPKKRLIDVIKDGDEIFGETYHGKTQFIKTDNDGCHLAIHPIYKEYGKVIGEFMCHDISTYETEFYPHDKQPVYEAITEWNAENEVWEAVASNCDTYRTNFLKSTCMCLEDFRRYLGAGVIPFYGWHISDLVIYDKPRELKEFYRECSGIDDTGLCYECDKAVGEECDCAVHYELHLTRPPQSWCYVEEIS